MHTNVRCLQYVVKLVIKPIIFSPVARQPALLWQTISCRTRWVVVHILAAEYEVDVTTHDGVVAHFICIHQMPV